MLSNSLVCVFLNASPSSSQDSFKSGRGQRKRRRLKIEEKILKRLGFMIECKSFTLNGKMNFLKCKLEFVGQRKELRRRESKFLDINCFNVGNWK